MSNDSSFEQLDIDEIINDDEILELKNQINEKKKALEYKRLKSDLADIAYKARHELTEFDGGMKQVDTEKALKSKKDSQNFFELLAARLGKMLSVRPIMGSIIGISLTLAGLVAIFNFLHNPKIDPYKIYLAYLLESALAVQVLKSASRSLFLPILATVVGLVVANSISDKQLFLQHHQIFYQTLMMLGLVGVAISVFTID